MQILELYDLITWVNKNVVTTQIIKKYQRLAQIIGQNIQPNNPHQPFEIPKVELITALKEIETSELTSEQLEFLDFLELKNYLGEIGIVNLEDILFKNNLDLATVYNKLNEIIAKLNAGITKITNILTGIGDYCKDNKELKKDILLRIKFTKDASVSNLSELKAWGNIWYEIGRGVSIIEGGTPEDIKIVGASNGSLIFDLAVLMAVAKIVSKILNYGFDLVGKYLDLMLKAEEIRHLNLKNDQIAIQIEKEAQLLKEDGAKEILSKLQSEFENLNRLDGEKINALTLSITRILDFINKGGTIDCVVPEEVVENDEEKKALKASFENIRKLESTIRLIESKDQKASE